MDVIFPFAKQHLYPYSINEQQYCKILDRKRKLFSDEEILKDYEPYSLQCAIILEQCMFKCFNQKKELLKEYQLDYDIFKHAIFGDAKAVVFTNILENYLFKLFLNKENPEQNSSFICGKVVNSVLKHIDTLKNKPVI